MKSVAFLRECGAFFMLTENEGKPAGRPFGAVMGDNGKLYFSTGRKQKLWGQILKNPHIQVIALKHGTRDWIRIDGVAAECTNPALKEKMFAENPRLQQRYKSVDDPMFVLIEVSSVSAFLNQNGVFQQIDE